MKAKTGQCGDNVYWSLDDKGLLTISGSGSIYYYKVPYSPFNERTDIETVIIGNGITEMGSNVFYLCSSIKTITIPASVKEISNYDFNTCLSLTEINVAEDNEKYSSSDGVLFNKDKTELICCPKGKTGSYIIPESVQEIGIAFVNCNLLESITVPGGVNEISSCSFRDCSSLTEINVADGNKLFSSSDGVLFNKEKTELICCPNGKTGSYIIPDGVQEKGDAFENCNLLESITIPGSVKDLYVLAFSDCSSLKEINVADDNKKFSSADGVLFNKKKTELKCYPQGKRGSYIIPNGVKKIGIWAFVDCVCLTSIAIPNSVKKIASGAFEGCNSLKTITIPGSVKELSCYSFSDCSSLTEINVADDNEQYSSVDGVLFNMDKTELLYCPEGKSGSYIMPKGVTKIGHNAFHNCDCLRNIIISNGVKKIRDEVFLSSSLESITIPDSVKKISDYAFSGCSSLKAITIPDGIKTIGDYTFNGCISLESVTIPNSVKTIGYSAFNGCSSLKTIEIPGSIKTIGDCAFSGCSSLKTITIPGSVKEISRYAFNDCSSLTEINVADDNKVYSSVDGVLFNKDKTEQIFCPEGKKEKS